MSNRWFKTYEEDIRLLLKDPTALQIYNWVRLNVDDDGTMTCGRNKAAEALGIEPKTFQKALHDRLCKRWGILEATPSSNGKFTVIKFKDWDRYRPYYQNHQHGSTKAGDLKERIKPNVDHVALRGGMLLLPIQYQDVVYKTVIDDSEKIEDGRWQCDTGTWHNAGASCYCNVEMIETDDKTIRLEERKPGQLPAPAREEKVIPPARSRRDTFSYNHAVPIKSF
jgi:hypothetical protein